MNLFELPKVTSYGWAIVVFLGALLFFHLIFLKIRPLGKIGWKRVDYIWLILGLLGVIAGVGSTRQAIAERMFPQAKEFAKHQALWVQQHIDFGSSPAICRQFVPSELFPRDEEFERRQREYNALCNWFKKAKLSTTHGLPKERPLTLSNLVDSPIPSGIDPYVAGSLQQAIKNYNEAQAVVDLLARERSRSDLEFILAAIGPFLIAVAIALRMTKVTGELQVISKENK